MKTVAVVGLTVLALAASQTDRAMAGDREWAVAGKVLTGVVAAGVIAEAFRPAPVAATTAVVYQAPPPTVVYAAPPPTVVYATPPPPPPATVVYAPAPVVYAPAPVVYAPAPVYYVRPAPVCVAPVVSVGVSFGPRFHGHYHGHWR